MARQQRTPQILLLLAALGMTVWILGTGCDDNLHQGPPIHIVPSPDKPNPVQNLRVEVDPNDGAKFLFRWDEPIINQNNSNVPDDYKAFWINTARHITDYDSIETTEVIVDPMGTLGYFEIVARNEHGWSEPNSLDVQLLGWPAPYYIYLVDIHDEPTFGFSGVEWQANESYLGYRMGYMQDFAERLDFYASNFVEGSDASPYYIASPHLALGVPVDSAVVNTVLGLAHTEVLDIGTTPPDVLPDPTDTPYGDIAVIATDHYYAVKMQDDFYGVLYVNSYVYNNYLSTEVRAWAHPVRGSRVFGLTTTP